MNYTLIKSMYNNNIRLKGMAPQFEVGLQWYYWIEHFFAEEPLDGFNIFWCFFYFKLKKKSRGASWIKTEPDSWSSRFLAFYRPAAFSNGWIFFFMQPMKTSGNKVGNAPSGSPFNRAFPSLSLLPFKHCQQASSIAWAFLKWYPIPFGHYQKDLLQPLGIIHSVSCHKFSIYCEFPEAVSLSFLRLKIKDAKKINNCHR